jgi:hypothetical protein
MVLWSFGRPIRSFLSITLLITELLGAGAIAAQTPSADRGTGAEQKSLTIPAGTVLPVSVIHGFSSKSAKAGQAVTARIMQEVPLPNDTNIPEGARVLGTIASVQRAGSGSGRISLRFDNLEIHHRSIPILTNLRALAGFMEVQSAETPEFSPGFGTPSTWITTRQIGGDEVYGVGGAVTDQWSNPVGKAVFGGVLVHLRAQPGTKCRGALDAEDRPQALWVFSSDACGVYGMAGVTIAHAGRTEPKGEIVLAREQRDVLVRGGSGMLLRVIH